jgi:glycerol-3-phosphate cytidylyltransferase-like family protein
MMVRVFPAVAFRFLGETHTQQGLIYDGIFMTVITADICVAKMAKRELHPWIVCMAMASIFNHFVILVLTLIYYAVVFADICHYMNLPLLSCCRNVYCDGVYDLCHIGHKNAFRRALSFGNRLFVGIMGDADCATYVDLLRLPSDWLATLFLCSTVPHCVSFLEESNSLISQPARVGRYKRPPVMSHAERCAEVEACKSVTKVIPNAPCFGLTQEFLDKHRIHGTLALSAAWLEPLVSDGLSTATDIAWTAWNSRVQLRICSLQLSASALSTRSAGRIRRTTSTTGCPVNLGLLATYRARRHSPHRT